MSDLIVEKYPDGSALFKFRDGYVCHWRLADARGSKLRFDTPEAARLAWALSPAPHQTDWTQIMREGLVRHFDAAFGADGRPAPFKDMFGGSNG